MNVDDCMLLNRYDRLMRAADQHDALGRRHNKRTWCNRAAFLNYEASLRFSDLMACIEREALGGLDPKYSPNPVDWQMSAVDRMNLAEVSARGAPSYHSHAGH
jgi:hypothetical protein